MMKVAFLFVLRKVIYTPQLVDHLVQLDIPGAIIVEGPNFEPLA